MVISLQQRKQCRKTCVSTCCVSHTCVIIAKRPATIGEEETVTKTSWGPVCNVQTLPLTFKAQPVAQRLDDATTQGYNVRRIKYCGKTLASRDVYIVVGCFYSLCSRRLEQTVPSELPLVASVICSF